MFSYFGTVRRAVQERDKALSERDFWKTRALELESKLEQRSDFFIEREFKLVDRFLTSQVKTYAITDEIKAKEATQEQVDDADLITFLKEKKDFLLECAIEAGEPDPQISVDRIYNAHYNEYVAEFQAG